MLETPLMERLRIEAENRMLSLSELCRIKLKGSDRLVKIEMLLEKIAKTKNINTCYDTE